MPHPPHNKPNTSPKKVATLRYCESGEEVVPHEVAPGKFMTAVPEIELQKCAITRFKPQPDGSYKPVVIAYNTWVRLSPKLPDQLGLGQSLTYRTLSRLAVAGFIKSAKPSPQGTTLCVESIFAHIEATKDPDFWTPAKLEAYRHARCEA